MIGYIVLGCISLVLGYLYMKQLEISRVLKSNNEYLYDITSTVPIELLTASTIKKDVMIENRVKTMLFLDTSPDIHFIRKYTNKYGIVAMVYPREGQLLLDEDSKSEFIVCARKVQSSEASFSFIVVLPKNTKDKTIEKYENSKYIVSTFCEGMCFSSNERDRAVDLIMLYYGF